MSVRRREDFEMVYVPLENENLEVEYIPTFDFKETWTYKYMVYSFQFVERDIRQYSSYRSFRLFKLFRLISNLLMVAALCFDFMLFVQIFKEESDDLSFLSKIVTALVMTLWMTRHSVLYTSGTYLFAKHPNTIREISARLQYSKEASYEESKEMKKKLKEIDEKMNKLISVTLILLVLIPLLVKFSPFIVEMIINQKYKWRSWQLELGEMFVILYTRIASMPFFFYLIYCGLLQRYQVQEYCKAIKNPDYKGTLDDAFQGYVEIHQSISDNSENNKLYLKVFFSVIVTWGTLYAYFAVGMLRSLVKIDTKEVFYVFAAYDFFTQLLKYVLEVAILFSTLYYRLLRVEEELEETQSRILEVRCSTLPDDHCLKRMADSMDLVRHIRKYQKHDEPGYQVFHGRLSRIKMIWLILLSPLILYLANSVIEGKLRESA